MHPKNVKRRRQVGNPRPFWGIRPTEEVQAFIDARVAEGAARSSVLVDMLEEAKDAREELGDDYWEIMRQAAVEKLPLGTVLGRLAKAALKASKR